MYKCPACGKELVRKQGEYGLYWVCADCQNWLIGFSILHHVVSPDYLKAITLEMSKGGQPEGIPCPICSHPMSQIHLSAEQKQPFVFCKICEMSWLSPEERAAIPTVEPPKDSPDPSQPQLSPEAVKKIALAEVEMMSEKARESDER
jgi:ssDNA-binding Zn-finger/Zn-ribbon topoisomerase 1